jgi:hypothetical protein
MTAQEVASHGHLQRRERFARVRPSFLLGKLRRSTTTSIESPIKALAEANRRLSAGTAARWERNLLRVSVGAGVTVPLSYLLLWGFPSLLVRWKLLVAAVVIVCVVPAALMCLWSAAAIVLYFIRLLIDPVDLMLNEMEVVASRERAEIAQLAERFSQQQLDQACERLLLDVAQRRQRTALLVGAVEKFGAVPGAVVALYFIYEVVRKEGVWSPNVALVVGGGSVVFTVAVHQLYVCLRLEKLALLARRAADNGMSRPSATRSDSLNRRPK